MREDKQTMPRNHRQPTTNPTKQQPTQPISKQTASHQPIKPTALQTLALPKQKSLAPDRLAGTRKKPEAKCIMLWEACLPHRVNPDAIITVYLTENASKNTKKNVRKKSMAKHEKCRKVRLNNTKNVRKKSTNNNEKCPQKARQTTRKNVADKQHEQPRKKNGSCWSNQCGPDHKKNRETKVR
jgi:hypothetical protein